MLTFLQPAPSSISFADAIASLRMAISFGPQLHVMRRSGIPNSSF